mmetsp:Transcript_10721/g.17765  ORF Transcript_10721/g.17765 Transcript_10721/m.17765 type:complete len:197 (-) Transcript_10721:893-1483(-)
MVEIKTANTMEEYVCTSINPASTAKTAMTKANSPSAAKEKPVIMQSRKCKPVKRLVCVKLGTKKPAASFPRSATVKKRPCQMTVPEPNSLTGTWKPILAAKKDAHEPLQDAFELRHKNGVQAVAAAKGETGDKGSHEETRLGIKGGGHEDQQHAQQNGQLHLGVIFLRDTSQNILVNQARKDVNRQVASQDKEQQS